jgi:hypothetical protein
VLWYRRLRYGYAFRRIRMQEPRYAIVDPADYERLKGYTWYVRTGTSTFYAFRHGPTHHRSKGRYIYMHQAIIHVPEKMVADHINHDGMDNRKANLRAATRGQNVRNRKKFAKSGSSKYKGVSSKKKTGKWVARISVNNKIKYLGCFKDEIEAARAYDEAAKIHHGEFACLNFPDSPRINTN